MDRTATPGWHLPTAALAIAAAGVAAVITATPAASGQPERTSTCRTEVSASGPLVRDCIAPPR